MSFISLFTLLGFSIANATPDLTYLEEQNPQEYARISSLEPIPTRAGHLRFVGSDLVDAKWAPLYLERYTNGTESTDVRNALLDLLYRTLGTLPEEAISSYDEEPAQIRASIIEMTDFGVIIPEKVQKDPSALVRAAFVRQVAKSPQASQHFIIYALQDEDPKVLADAARAAHQKECRLAHERVRIRAESQQLNDLLQVKLPDHGLQPAPLGALAADPQDGRASFGDARKRFDHDVVSLLSIQTTDGNEQRCPAVVTHVRNLSRLSLDEREIGGLGVHLVRSLVDNVTYQRRTNRNVVTLVKRL